jgi:type I restriction enzyme S subunit
MRNDSQLLVLRDLLIATKDGDWGKSEPQEGYVPYRVIRGADFPAARLGQTSALPLRYLAARTVTGRTLRSNDILIETAGGTKDRPTGRTLLITDPLLARLDLPATCASFARFLRVDPAQADPRLIYWYLQNLYATGEMAQHQVQHTGVARFQYTRFAETQRIALPPRNQQESIAEVLGALDDKIEWNTRVAVFAERLAIALFQGCDTATQLLEIAKPERARRSPGDFSNAQVDHFSLPAFDASRRPERCLGATVRSGKFLLTAPVILVSRLNPHIARVWRAVPRDDAMALASTEFIVLDPIDGVTSQELWAVCASNSSTKELAERVTGTTGSHQRVRADDVLHLSVADPRAVSETTRGAARDLVDRAYVAREENVHLAALRDTLLPRLLSGELRVRDVETMVGETV